MSVEGGASPKRCECGICRVSQALQAKRLNRQRISEGVDWMLDRWCDEEMRLSHLLHAVKDSLDRGDAVPEEIIAAFDLAAKDTALARDYNPKRWKVIGMPQFVDEYAKLSGRDPAEARRKLKELGVAPHLEAVDE